MPEIVYALAIVQTAALLLSAWRYREVSKILRTVEEREDAIRHTCNETRVGWPDIEQRLAETQTDVAELMGRLAAIEPRPGDLSEIRKRMARLME